MLLTKSCSDYDATARFYDRSHSRWLRHAGGEAQCAFEGAVAALLRPGVSLLDAACGSGAVARRLLRSAADDIDLVLLDLSQRMLAACADIRARPVRGSMEHLPFTDNSFDLVTCAWGLETLCEPLLALSEFVRIVRPGGRVCLVFCADLPVRSIAGAVLRRHVRHTQRGRFLNCDSVADDALRAGASHVQRLHCSGPAAAMIVHV